MTDHSGRIILSICQFFLQTPLSDIFKPLCQRLSNKGKSLSIKTNNILPEKSISLSRLVYISRFLFIFAATKNVIPIKVVYTVNYYYMMTIDEILALNERQSFFDIRIKISAIAPTPTNRLPKAIVWRNENHEKVYLHIDNCRLICAATQFGSAD